MSRQEPEMTQRIREMLDAHPDSRENPDVSTLEECIAACMDCAQCCTACADSCLAEEMVVGLATCIRLDLDCADVCHATGQVLSRQTSSDVGLVRALLEACQASCAACADECEKHADAHRHCGICAEQCRRCEEACGVLLGKSA
jgi:hypothetical protein